MPPQLNHTFARGLLLNINPNLTLLPNGEPMYPDLWFASWICVEQADGNLAFKGMEAIF